MKSERKISEKKILPSHISRFLFIALIIKDGSEQFISLTEFFCAVGQLETFLILFILDR